MPTFLEVCEQATRAGGETLLKWRGKVSVNEKAPSDLVTEADFEAQAVIRRLVSEAFPSHRFVGEETPEPDNRGSGLSPSASGSWSPYRWVVDPLDGTTNFVHGLPLFCTSVALEKDGRPVVGAIFNPVTEEMYLAESGRGATLNGEPIRASGVWQVEQAMAAASFGYQIEVDSEEIQSFLALLPHAQALRRLGSSALNLAFVACGRLDAYWTTSAKLWDIAAGVLLVSEAGGCVLGLDDEPWRLERPRLVAAATPALAEEIRGLIRSH